MRAEHALEERLVAPISWATLSVHVLGLRYLLPLVLLRPETRTTPQSNYLPGQVFTELNPAPSPSGHPLLSGPPT